MNTTGNNNERQEAVGETIATVLDVALSSVEVIGYAADTVVTVASHIA